MSAVKQDLDFVEKAHQEAASSPILPGQKEADQLLAEARAQIYFWPKNFAGFQARVSLEGMTWQLQAPSSRRLQLEGPEHPELLRWLRYHLGEMISHREHPEISRMASKTGVTWGDYDGVYGQRLDFAGDKMSSFYRVREGRIQQISRRYGGQHFLICIDRHHCLAGRFAAANYAAYYWDGQDQLCKVENYHDDYQKIGRVWLPCLRRFSQIEGQQRLHRELRLDQIELLPRQQRNSPCKK